MVDWGIGSYEQTAQQLLPASQTAVRLAGITVGSRVLDVGCGTGNAALLAGETGARVVGVDPAQRLLSVARDRAREAGLDLGLVQGDAQALPLGDGVADVVLSVFAVIFAGDPVRAAAECRRVVAPHGRVVLTAWLPGGPMQEMMAGIQELTLGALGAPPPPEGFPWHEPDRVGDALGLRVTASEHEIVYDAASAEDYFEQGQQHPMAVSGTELLTGLGRQDVSDAIRERSLEVLRRGNVARDGFRMVAGYRVLVCER